MCDTRLSSPDLAARPRTGLPGGHGELAPPDPIPNSEVKRLSADGSVGFPHVRVSHRQALTPNPPQVHLAGGLFFKMHQQRQ